MISFSAKQPWQLRPSGLCDDAEVTALHEGEEHGVGIVRSGLLDDVRHGLAEQSGLEEIQLLGRQLAEGRRTLGDT